MALPMSTQERQLSQLFAELPHRFKNRYTEDASRELLENLFWSLAGGKTEYMKLFFPEGRPSPSLSLREAQGAVDGAEYTEAARGKTCGHIFKTGEPSYKCRTCSSDPTCCLCSRCFESTDHEGHLVTISPIVGDSSCCDCGDVEAWDRPMFCSIHSELPTQSTESKSKGKEVFSLPEDLMANMQMTIGRVYDFLCDVISCAPEQLRLPKTVQSIEQDEISSRLLSRYYGADCEHCPEFALILWNDEKHTVDGVRNQVARACQTSMAFGTERALETDAIGRSIVHYDTDIENLLDMAKILEHIKLTITIRSSRDTFREHMCGTMIEWLADIAGCSVGREHHVLRQIVCKEMLKEWRQGSAATHSVIGQDGCFDEEAIIWPGRFAQANPNTILTILAFQAGEGNITLEFDDDDDDDDEDYDEDEMAMVETGNTTPSTSGEEDNDLEEDDIEMTDARASDPSGDTSSMDWHQPDQALEEHEATMAGYPAPPPPPPPASASASASTSASAPVSEPVPTSIQSQTIIPTIATPTSILNTETSTASAADNTIANPTANVTATTIPASSRRQTRDRDVTPSDSDTAEPLIAPSLYAKANLDIPKTTGQSSKESKPRPGRHWVETPPGYLARQNAPLEEDIFRRVRLDWLILFDLRMWKKVRNSLRNLYISTVIQVPEFKRILSLRFAGLYTTLAQLYLIGDREPDHSIIGISVQIATTPSITAEMIENGNFLTSLLAIVYTFLTTRQVGYPWEVSSSASLAIDSSTVSNRRMNHFYQDLKYLFALPYVQHCLRSEERYLLQFLDLLKLHQGIGPNVRAIGEHVEYETDGWINAQLATKEVNSKARQLVEAFRKCPTEDSHLVSRAIRLTAKTTILNSIGADRQRFKQAEIKDKLRLKILDDFEFDAQPTQYRVVKFVVEEEPISFHHGLHYMLSWLIECARNLPASVLKDLLTFSAQDLLSKPRCMGRPDMPRRSYSPEDYLMAIFDFPLRVCAWLAQIKATMWVRNGISLRHQAATYRGLMYRDVSHQRDIFLLQTALVICDPSRVLASIVDRYGMEKWIKGFFEQKSDAQDDLQHLDVVEDMIHLLILLLCDRMSLLPSEDNKEPRVRTIRRDLIHVVCFKPLSYNEICNKLPPRHHEHEQFLSILDEVTTFKQPEGVTDVGTFELRPEIIEEVDPYTAHYTKNQREEAENAYRKRISQKSGKPVDEIVYEPRLQPIQSGVFKDLGAFTRTGMFCQIVYYSLLYPLVASKFTPTVPVTRAENFLQVVLHLIIIAIDEDSASQEETGDANQQSFTSIALTRTARSNFLPESPSAKTIVALLDLISGKEEFQACHLKISLILKRMKQRQPVLFAAAYNRLGISVDRISTASPANNSAEEERERKKQAALSRQAKVMAQFQQQQKSFMENQGAIDWGVDEDDDDDVDIYGDESGVPQAEQMGDVKNERKYPAETCILCQEPTDERRLYGTFAHFSESRVLRQTDMRDPDYVREVFHTPCNLDRSADTIRPFGVAGENIETISKLKPNGDVETIERHTVAKGFPEDFCNVGPVAIGCGHLMHHGCFEMYFEATKRRHLVQVARHQPENCDRLEFVCPLCKALGNAFLPIIWRGKEESYPGVLQAKTHFGDFVGSQLASVQYVNGSTTTSSFSHPQMARATMFATYTRSTFVEWNDDKNVQTGSGQLGELMKAYRRIRGALMVNDIQARYSGSSSQTSPEDNLNFSDVLVASVGYTVSAIEIQQRGTEAQLGMTFIEKIPEQTLIQLRILAETATSYVSFGGLELVTNSPVDWEYRRDCERQYSQLFIAENFGVRMNFSRRSADLYSPLMAMDSFLFFNEALYGTARDQRMDTAHLLRLCYLAELTRVVLYIKRNMSITAWTDLLSNPSFDPDSKEKEEASGELVAFAKFASWITSQDISLRSIYRYHGNDHENSDGQGFTQPTFSSLSSFVSFAKKYALVFLRKSALLLYIKNGVNLVNYVSPQLYSDELVRLEEALQVPSFEAMCMSVTEACASYDWPSTTRNVVEGWIRHSALWPQSFTTSTGRLGSSHLSHPGIFELVGLPKAYDLLIEASMKGKCPTTGKDLSDPAICLFCGAMICFQSMCCTTDDDTRLDEDQPPKIGGAQQHMRKCQKTIGMFLIVKKCAALYLHRMSGTFGTAPYTDRFGEVDWGMRHGRQLFLNQKRYDFLFRNTFLSHGIPALISRKLEAEVNNGGWETL